MSTSSDKDLNTFVPTAKKITVAGTEFEIKPFVLKNRIKVVRIIAEAMVSMGQSLSPEIQANPMRAIPLLIDAAGERVRDIYAIVLEKDAEWLDNNIQLRDEIEILTAIFEVNDIPFIARRIQEMLPKMAQQAK